LAALLLVRLADESAIFLLFGALESFRADLGLSYAQAGLVLASIGPGALVGGVFSAAADRYSRRVIVAGGAFGLALSLVMFALGASFAVLVSGGFVMGMASTAMVDGAEVALVDMAGDDLRRYLARSNLLATVGDLLGPALVAATVALGLSWRVAFGAGAVLMALYGLALAGSPLPPPVRHGDDCYDGDAAPRPGLRAVADGPILTPYHRSKTNPLLPRVHHFQWFGLEPGSASSADREKERDRRGGVGRDQEAAPS